MAHAPYPYMLSGNLDGSPPANSIGAEGNYFFDESNGNIWGPKTNGVWPSPPATPAYPGGSGTPGGADGDIQYNNAGAFGGIGSTGTGNVIRASVVRTKLAANATYYVNTSTGNNANDGSIGSPWATIQYGVDWCFANLDFAYYKVTIIVADATINEDIVVNGLAVGQAGVASFEIIGNTTTPANCEIVNGSYAFTANNGAQFTVDGFKFSGGGGLAAFGGGRISSPGNLDFGDCTGGIHIDSEDFSVINVTSPYTISGGAWAHAYCYGASLAIGGASTITVSGTPAFSNDFAKADSMGNIYAAGLTFSGSATGKRYECDANSVINTGGGGANYFPGNSAGTTGTGGQYI